MVLIYYKIEWKSDFFFLTSCHPLLKFMVWINLCEIRPNWTMVTKSILYIYIFFFSLSSCVCASGVRGCWGWAQHNPDCIWGHHEWDAGCGCRWVRQGSGHLGLRLQEHQGIQDQRHKRNRNVSYDFQKRTLFPF